MGRVNDRGVGSAYGVDPVQGQAVESADEAMGPAFGDREADFAYGSARTLYEAVRPVHDGDTPESLVGEQQSAADGSAAAFCWRVGGCDGSVEQVRRSIFGIREEYQRRGLETPYCMVFGVNLSPAEHAKLVETGAAVYGSLAPAEPDLSPPAVMAQYLSWWNGDPGRLPLPAAERDTEFASPAEYQDVLRFLQSEEGWHREY